MTDMLKAFGTIGTASGPTYRHPLEEEIIRESSSLLMKIPEGKRLLRYAKDNDISFFAISGRQPDFQVADARTIYVVCPANTRGVDVEEMACNLALGIRVIEQPSVGIPKPVPNTADLERVTLNHMLDIIIEMCKIGDEIAEATGSTKLVDQIKNLGHAELHRGIRSGLSHQELAEILSKNIK